MNMRSRTTDARKEYKKSTLIESDIVDDPIEQFAQWYDSALAAGVPEPEAMTLSTATCDGRPSARIVLLRGFDHGGFRFFTNYASRKGKELVDNPFAALTFYWPQLERQVRIEGDVQKLRDAESDTYFQSRPRNSRIGAIISPQSESIANREVLEQRFAEYQKKYSENESIPRPSNWGGYRLKPSQIEFWQGRPSRLHDRIQFRHLANGSWSIERLAP